MAGLVATRFLFLVGDALPLKTISRPASFHKSAYVFTHFATTNAPLTLKSLGFKNDIDTITKDKHKVRKTVSPLQVIQGEEIKQVKTKRTNVKPKALALERPVEILLCPLYVLKPVNQVLSSMVDQEAGHQIEHDNLNLDGTYTVEEFEVRILEPESSGGPWQTKGTICMQSSENALTVRVVTLFNTTTRENETLLAVGTAYVQGEDVAARGRVLLFSVESGTENPQATVSEVYSKEMKGAISALASIQGYLLVASGPKVILHKWTGTELSGVAFFDAPPLMLSA